MLPVLIVAFKRPDKLKLCLEYLFKIKPTRVYVAVDGPRTKRETREVKEVKELLAQAEWPCPVVYRFAETNAGCRAWVSSAISWFFAQEEFGIIIEEDILVDRRFFAWCEQLRGIRSLHPEVMHLNAFEPLAINGVRLASRKTMYVTSWGWATWREAWAQYDDAMRWFQNHGIIHKYIFFRKILGRSRRVSLFYVLVYLLTFQGKNSSWAYRWTLSVWSSGGVALTPGLNLSENIGTGAGATHTSVENYLQQIRMAEGSLVPSSTLAAKDDKADVATFHIVNGSRRVKKLLRLMISVVVPNRCFFWIRKKIRG